MGAKLGKLTAIVGGDAKAVRPVPSVAGDAVARPHIGICGVLRAELAGGCGASYAA
jgi:hypothetical protein